NLKYPECDVVCARIVGEIIRYEGANTVAALIAEPIVLSTGNLVPPPEYFPILREICDETNVLLIFDEIITGFGRTGQMWGAETFNAVPDILCMGKGMSCGYAPLAAIAFRDDIAEAFYGEEQEEVEFAHGHTYGGNPVSCAAGIAAVHETIERDLPKRAREAGDYLCKHLEELKELGIIGEIRAKGLMIGIEFVKDDKTMSSFPEGVRFGTQVGRTCISKYKLLVRYAPNWIAIAPPLTITTEELDSLLERLTQGIKEVLEKVKKP
ncbi:MAG: aminotransferase class III-fold pyridoxal phosphate-dependent enzyme, partial [Candidatus Bathyarchaeia archaeon]